ncbi:hypothetical protein A2U01_0048198, partial [Trifolium medium]|nr:hypothetical protein [Trifolium medium]
GYALGEDTCLFEDDDASEASQSDHEEGHGDPEVRRHVDALVEQFAEDFEEEDDLGSQENRKLSSNRVADEVVSVEELSKVGKVVATQPVLGMDHLVGSDDCVSGKGASHRSLDRLESPSICSPVEGLSHSVSIGGHEGSLPRSSRSKHTKSCPPVESRSVLSGPWSLEWLQDLNQG